MLNNEILKLLKDCETKQLLNSKWYKNLTQDFNEVCYIFEKGIKDKNVRLLEFLFYYTDIIENIKLIHTLLLQRWHSLHEPIISHLQSCPDDQNILIILKVIEEKIWGSENKEYLYTGNDINDYDQSYPIACISVYALAKIGSVRAKAALEHLLAHIDEYGFDEEENQPEYLKEHIQKRLTLWEENYSMYRKINALFTDQTITVYQAFNKGIAEEAVTLQKFGNHFKKDRMTWIKTSFMWMMYRSGWSTKPNQERILAIEITIDGFLTALKQSTLSSFEPDIHQSYDLWQEALKQYSGRIQWDPERNFRFFPLRNRAIQIGLDATLAEQYNHQWIKKITDITEIIHKISIEIEALEGNHPLLPAEKYFEITDPSILKRLFAKSDIE